MGFIQQLFGAPKAFAIEVKAELVRLLVLEGGTGSWRELLFVERALPEGTIVNGEIKDVEVLANEIRAAAQGLPAEKKLRKIVTALPESHVFMAHVSISREVDKADVAGAVFMQAATKLPINLEQCAWDYQPVGDENEEKQVLFTAAETPYLEALEQAVALAGFELAVVEPESLAWTRALIHGVALDDSTAVLICDVGHHGANAVIVDKEGIERSIWQAAGSAALLEVVKKKVKVKNAEGVLWEKGMQDDAVAKVVGEWMDAQWADLAAEVTQYESASRRAVKGMCFTGEGSRVPGLKERWSKRLGKEIFTDCIPPLTPAHLTPESAAVIVGLAMRANKLSTGLNFIVPT